MVMIVQRTLETILGGLYRTFRKSTAAATHYGIITSCQLLIDCGVDIDSILPPTSLRSTASSMMSVLSIGQTLVYTNWHKEGEQIVATYAELYWAGHFIHRREPSVAAEHALSTWRLQQRQPDDYVQRTQSAVAHKYQMLTQVTRDLQIPGRLIRDTAISLVQEQFARTAFNDMNLRDVKTELAHQLIRSVSPTPLKLLDAALIIARTKERVSIDEIIKDAPVRRLQLPHMSPYPSCR